LGLVKEPGQKIVSLGFIGLPPPHEILLVRLFGVERKKEKEKDVLENNST
jgi:hypothetical protein